MGLGVTSGTHDLPRDFWKGLLHTIYDNQTHLLYHTEDKVVDHTPLKHHPLESEEILSEIYIIVTRAQEGGREREQERKKKKKKPSYKVILVPTILRMIEAREKTINRECGFRVGGKIF